MADQGVQESSGNLSHSVMLGSDVLIDICCDVCNEDGKQIEAEGFCVDCVDYLCGECFRGHRKNRLSRGHQLNDKTTMPRKKPSSAATLNLDNDTCTEPCHHHRDRIAEYFCKDHKQLGCSVCMTINHRTCQGVDHIPDLTEGLLQSPEYKQFEKNIESMKIRTIRVLKISDDNVTRSEQCSSNAVQHVLGLQNDMNKLFDAHADQVKNQADAIKSDDLERMKTVKGAGNQILNDTEKIASKIDDLKKKKQLCKLFTHMHETQDELKTLDEALEKTQSMNKVTDYLFESNTELKRVLDGSVSIGQIHVHSPVEVKPPAPCKDPNKISATWEKDVNVKSACDNKRCLISGIAVLPDNKLIIADWNNQNVKLVDICESVVTSELHMQGRPWDLALVTSSQVAVTLPETKQIAFVNIGEDLKLHSALEVEGDCRGIAYSNRKLFVTFVKPAVFVTVMDLQGKNEKKIKLKDARWASHVACELQSQTIFVSDYSSHRGESIVCITPGGRTAYKYDSKDFSGARGIDVDQLGRVFVCGERSRNIIILNPNCSKVKILVSGLKRPNGFSYCQQTNRLYVGFYTKNVVSVYQVS